MPASSRPWLLLSSSLVCLSFLAISGFVFVQWDAWPSNVNTSPSHTFRAPRPNIWADLSAVEVDDLTRFLLKRKDLNLTEARTASSDDNYLVLAEMIQPNKTDVAPFLTGDNVQPERWARILVSQGATEEAHIAEYMVGPLPTSASTEVRALSFCYNSGRNFVVNPIPNFQDLMLWGVEVGINVSDVTLELLGTKVDLLDPRDGLSIAPRVTSIINGTLHPWMQFYRAGSKQEAWSLLPQGLWLRADTSSRDILKWKTLDWYYNGHFYNSVDDLRAAIKQPGFKRSPRNLDGDWTDPAAVGKGIAGQEQQAPVMIQPHGPRYKLDKQQKYISWMGYELYMTTAQATGLSLFDLRFRGERIIYELGLQEAMAHYAGDDPTLGGQEFLDTFFGMGLRMFELVPGYDCPAYASFLDATFHTGASSQTNKNCICIFEYTADSPLQRHTAESRVTISRNNYLVIRFVSTVGNYDYTVDYILYLDGSIEVKVRASGFIFGAFWDARASQQRNEYGYKVHDAVSTAMHDHVMNFKADLDIAGTANTLVRTSLEPMSKDYDWDDDKSAPRNTMHLVHRPVSVETALNWPANSAEMLLVQNTNATNVWGSPRGYRIMPGTGIGTPPHLTIHNSSSLLKSADWSSADLWLTRRHDTEPRSASPMNFLNPDAPLIEFGKFVDGESTLQQDLVLWFNLGAHHVPNTGDVPNTLMHTSASSVVFSPFNFFERDVSREAVQGVVLGEGVGVEGEGRVRYWGGRYVEGIQLDKGELEPDLSRYGAQKHRVTDLSWGQSLLGAEAQRERVGRGPECGREMESAGLPPLVA